jgi:hypothetical protein
VFMRTVFHIGAVKLTAVGVMKITALLGTVVTTALMVGVPLQDPWFDAFTAFYIFSAITSGMPDPDKNSSFGYVWLYRSAHILSANGTAYFIHRNKWDEISGLNRTRTAQIEISESEKD